MGASPTPPDPASLLRHEGWLRRLALRLVEDEADADDVVQETWRRALERPPRDARALPAWLAHVARNAARGLWRTTARRRRREEAAARPERIPATIDVVARAETQRRLVDAVLALDEPFRTTVLLRYVDELSLREIADRHGVPEATVRSRLKRGLDRLRERFDAESHGDRGRWALALLSFARPGAPTLAAPTTVAGGVAIVSSTTKTIGGAVLVLLLLGGLVVVGSTTLPRAKDPTAVAVLPPEPPPAAAAPAPEPAPNAPRAEEPPAPRLRGRATEPVAAPASPAAPPADTARPYAAGRVVDADGQPIAGVRVAHFQNPRHLLLHGQKVVTVFDTPHGVLHAEEEPALALAITAEDGTFTVHETPKECDALAFLKPGWAVAKVQVMRPDLVVVLHPAWRLEGSVRETDGSPIAKALVVAMETAHLDDRVPTCTTTDAQGHYVFGSLDDVPVRVFVSVRQYAEGDPGVPDGTPDHVLSPPTSRCDFVLHRMGLVVDVVDAVTHEPVAARGVVTDPKDGSLVELLSREAWGMPSRAWNSLFPAPLGRLFAEYPPRRQGVIVNDRVDLRVFAPGYEPATQALNVRRGGEPPRVEVRLTRGTAEPSLAGRVLDGPGAHVEVRGLERPEERAMEPDDRTDHEVTGTTAASDGRFMVAGLPPGPYRLVVRLPGKATASLEVVAPRDDLQIRLEEPASLEIRTVTPAGEAAPDAWVTLDVRTTREQWEARTDGEGRARFEGLPLGNVGIVGARVSRGESGGLWHWKGTKDVDLAAGTTTSVEIVVPERVPTTVRVLDANGDPRQGLRMHLVWGHPFCRFDGSIEEWKRIGALELTTDEEGSVHQDLYPGTYWAHVEGLSSGPLERKFEVGLRPEPPVEVRAPAGTAVLSGRVLERTGAPIPERLVRVMTTEAPFTIVGQALTSASGAYEIRGLPAGRFRVGLLLESDSKGVLEIRQDEDGRAVPESPFPAGEAEVELRDGEKRSLGALAPRVRGEDAMPTSVEVAVRVVDPDAGRPVADAHVRVLARIGDVWFHVGEATSDGAGTATTEVVAATRYRLDVRAPDGRSAKTVEAAPRGGRVALDLEVGVR